ncbi:MAG: polysaccharide deacetylase family protein [Chloroflexi bacterium]|nr:polysaccharide deacetylase family protein [Chloroflexota bacterium]
MLRKYPDFVFQRVEAIRAGEIPVFVFHSVQPDYFESQLQYLVENRYKTVNADEFYEIILGKRKPEDKTVLLTFDDGRGSLWSTAYPLLKKYSMRAVCFILPGHIQEGDKHYPNLDDVWNGQAEKLEILQREQVAPLCDWREIEEMHESGVIDFQSHTSHHHSVFIKDRLVDFINPSFQASFLTSALYPAVRKNNQDTFPARLNWGHPIYESAPTMAADTRYIENEGLSWACIDYVKQEGGDAFFKKRGWRQELRTFMNEFANKQETSGRIQSAAERFTEIRDDLRQSKAAIEERLNKTVNHLCYPWYAGSETAVRASQEVGYACNYWGILNHQTINQANVTDPCYITRLNDDYIFSLPGKGRIGLLKLLARKFFRIAAAQ